MDGIHDLGGKLGYGSVDVNEPEEPFHYDYEGRMWAMSRIAKAPDINIDWWRHVRELIQEDDYLNRPYFDSWAQTTIATMIDSKVFTTDELASGVSATPPLADVLEVDYEGVLQQNAEIAFDFSRPVDTEPTFSVSQTVVTNKEGHSGHTRLPEYARGKTGVIHSYHNAHCFPDDYAKGKPSAQHLYTVAFTATELWGADANPNDRVTLELWEDYLAPK
ncbi:nitrile hydratase subunit beta [Amylibacter sp. SFDW26]|uniref:nitrile hydratase subunit beta n=1 Tax=Amylibacter sp. SFDW26 TaxID=2652722 RepID=UPI001262546D|nr:nitrile hydratase subunit beta [Amylibacter sp. SFDW26]KAB7613295.1 nitrile hydratase subunit beta [Amylibacter sp. SFDW26]